MADDSWLDWNEDKTAETFATQLGERWGVGHRGCDNGVVLFAAIGDRYAYLKTAKKAHEMISDSEAVRIIDHMKPELKSQDYDAAFMEGVHLIHSGLEGEAIGREPLGFGTLLSLLFLSFCTLYWFVLALWPLIVVPICFCCTYALMPCAMLADCCRRRSMRAKAEAAKQDAEADLQRLQEELKRDEFDQTMCPICLENFVDGSDASSPPSTQSVQKLACGHRFHAQCIGPWIAERGACPLCRCDVAYSGSVSLAPEHAEESQAYQNRLKFYLSRLQQRHAQLGRSGGGSHGAVYYVDTSGLWMLSSAHALQGSTVDGGTYAGTLATGYSSVMTSASHHFSSGGGGSFGGGGGFSGCGGGGGGGW
mmetsp:Transcript_70616/g.169199  ORF Transcript_70616/g.169199 Transcript_70616/m.169199 type:complete len:365 (-) Transcript_70616:71-1165(-)